MPSNYQYCYIYLYVYIFHDVSQTLISVVGFYTRTPSMFADVPGLPKIVMSFHFCLQLVDFPTFSQSSQIAPIIFPGIFLRLS